MSDSPTHPYALAMSCTKPARLEKRAIDRCWYIKVKDDMKQKKWRQKKMKRLSEGVQRQVEIQ